MSREIKFRAIGENSIIYSHSYTSLKWFFDACEGLPIEQYTGLKDKNGKEIYEGDIRREEYEGALGDITTYYVCVWIKELCCFSWLNIPEYTEYTDIDPQDFDVIFEYENPSTLDVSESHRYIICGNIHEHKHLLK